MKLENKAVNINLLQEECAELIQALSKLRRFPIDFINPENGVCNRDSLIQEMADVRVFMNAIEDDYNITEAEIEAAMIKKELKLEKFYVTQWDLS